MSRFVALVVLLVSFPSSAAIIYEPPGQFQFGDRRRYYYGGNDPSVHRFAAASFDRRTARNAQGQISGKPIRVYTDERPRVNARLFGWTPNDAKNDAYAAVPRYFQMSDQLAGGLVDPAGHLIVPATPANTAAPGRMELRAWRGWPSPKPLIVIPKSQMHLDAPLAAPGTPSKA